MNKIHVTVEVEFAASNIERFDRYVNSNTHSPMADAINQVVQILKDRGIENPHKLHYSAH